MSTAASLLLTLSLVIALLLVFSLFGEAFNGNDGSKGTFAIAGAIIIGAGMISLAIYNRPNK